MNTGPFRASNSVDGVTYDGQHVWIAAARRAERLRSGERTRRCARSTSPRTRAPPSTASICFRSPRSASRRSIPRPASVLATIPAPGGGGDSGLAWAEGSLWVGQYRERKIHQVDPETGAILRTIESNRFVTGVTWVDGELWHGTLGRRRERTASHRSAKPAKCWSSWRCQRASRCPGSNPMARDRFFCGGGSSGKVRAVSRPAREPQTDGGAKVPVDSTSD